MTRKKDSQSTDGETTSMPKSIESHGFVYEDRFKSIERITAKFGGFNKEYFVSDFGEKAAVLALKDDYILLARQYRLLINRVSYEVPGGKVDDGESPEEAAIRECFEETGVRCTNLKPLIAYDPDLEYTRNHTHVFYTHDLEDERTRPSSMHKWLPFDACLKMIEQGIITDSLSIITIMAYQLRIGRTSA